MHHSERSWRLTNLWIDRPVMMYAQTAVIFIRSLGQHLWVHFFPWAGLSGLLCDLYTACIKFLENLVILQVFSQIVHRSLHFYVVLLYQF